MPTQRHNPLARTLLASFGIILAALGCGGDPSPNPLAAPVYQVGQNTLFLGSVYYGDAGCAGCHGPQFDGKGPDAGSFQRENGYPVPGFKDVRIAAEKTPLAYFETITKGTERLPSHILQNYTDRGRWALAHFLYSLTLKPVGDDAHKHGAALAAADAKVREVYATNRRFVMGYTPLDQRAAKPQLDDLLKSGSAPALVEENAASPVDEDRRNRADVNHPGATLYANNCASCHGEYGEGRVAAKRFGLITDCKTNNRQCGVYLSTKDFARTGPGNVGALRAAHSADMNLPDHESWTDDQWQDVYEYTRILAGN